MQGCAQLCLLAPHVPFTWHDYYSDDAQTRKEAVESAGWFQGHLVTHDDTAGRQQFGLYGQLVEAPEGYEWHRCCMPSNAHDPFPVFYSVTVVHFDSNQRVTFSHVERTGAGDAVRLVSWHAPGKNGDEGDQVEMAFETRVIKVNQHARQHICRFFPDLINNDTDGDGDMDDAYVCMGDLSITNWRPLFSTQSLLDALPVDENITDHNLLH